MDRTVGTERGRIAMSTDNLTITNGMLLLNLHEDI